RQGSTDVGIGVEIEQIGIEFNTVDVRASPNKGDRLGASALAVGAAPERKTSGGRQRPFPQRSIRETVAPLHLKQAKSSGFVADDPLDIHEDVRRVELRDV